jgi:hypothetical protein
MLLPFLGDHHLGTGPKIFGPIGVTQHEDSGPTGAPASGQNRSSDRQSQKNRLRRGVKKCPFWESDHVLPHAVHRSSAAEYLEFPKVTASNPRGFCANRARPDPGFPAYIRGMPSADLEFSLSPKRPVPPKARKCRSIAGSLTCPP